jgi:hypothetical protein
LGHGSDVDRRAAAGASRGGAIITRRNLHAVRIDVARLVVVRGGDHAGARVGVHASVA